MSNRKSLQVILSLLLAISLLAGAAGTATAGSDDELKADPRLLQMAEENPDAIFMVIIQRDARISDLKKMDLEDEVLKGGGQVKKQLDLIFSFSAELTGKQILKLAKHPLVHWISVDAPMGPSLASGFTALTLADYFPSASYYGSSGSEGWTSPWVESGETDGPGAGKLRVASNARCASGYCFYIGGSSVAVGTHALTRAANLKGATAGANPASLTFSYRRYRSAANTGSVKLQISPNNGISWTTLATYTLSASDAGQISQSFDITAYANEYTQVRFQGVGTLAGYIYFDNITVNYVEPPADSPYRSVVGADWLPASLQGQGVTVAVVDSGITPNSDLGNRLILSNNQTSDADSLDGYGHGTHVAGILAGNGTNSGGIHTGIAPQANIINVKVSNGIGMTYASDFIDGLQWIYNNKAAYNIKVVNISMNSTIAESYTVSAICAAVEILWFNGITVVVSAGNTGEGTLYPPANDPFVITVGSADDMGTIGIEDDLLSDFSAFGITYSGFAKPDIVAPGRNIISLNASTSSNSYVNHPTHRHDDNYYFRMNGTSMSAPIVAGAAALLLQDEPWLNPDQVKYRLMATANTNWLGYATAGVGYLDIPAAIYGYTYGSANQGILPSLMLFSGSDPISWDSVGWNSVGWNSVGWNSVGWNSVGWNTVGWNTVGWNTVGWNTATWDQ